MTEKERMLAGKLYMAGDTELVEARRWAHGQCKEFNDTGEDAPQRREEILRVLLGGAGSNVYIEPSFRCDYGRNITVGDWFYANFDCILLDVCPITIGDRVMLGPRVCVYTAGHPLDAAVRAGGLEFGAAVTIGSDVWVGGSTVINPGVTIGSDVVIGSGSVVTRDIPDHVVAVGNPCRVLRPITEEDRRHWEEEARRYKGRQV